MHVLIKCIVLHFQSCSLKPTTLPFRLFNLTNVVFAQCGKRNFFNLNLFIQSGSTGAFRSRSRRLYRQKGLLPSGLLIAFLRAKSSTVINRNGAKGSPCNTPVMTSKINSDIQNLQQRSGSQSLLFNSKEDQNHALLNATNG